MHSSICFGPFSLGLTIIKNSVLLMGRSIVDLTKYGRVGESVKRDSLFYFFSPNFELNSLDNTGRL